MQPSSSKRWRVLPPLPTEAQAALAPYTPILQQLLYNRSITAQTEAAELLDSRAPAGCDPCAMLGMCAAVDRLEHAVRAGEPVVVYGDYDVDGVTATALMVQALEALGADVRAYIPNRFDEGYGLNNEALDQLAAQGARIVLTVDCGIRSVAEAEHACALGLEMIISDHHHPTRDLPRALAVINPRQEGDGYPYKELTGVGLAYKLAHALVERFPDAGVAADDWLDLVALGTVADLAPLSGENRALVARGLAAMREAKRPGLVSLANVAMLDLRKVNAVDIGFILGPRLNAAGRLESARAAYDLLMADNILEAAPLAQQLDNQNTQRKKVTRAIEAQVQELLQAVEVEMYIIFAVDSSFNSGVVGLAASRLAETYHRPAIVAWQGEEVTRGSCRSISDFHITQALDECAELLVRHGGHAAAAGFTVRNEHLPELRSRLEAIALRELKDRDLKPVLVADMETQLVAMTPSVMKDIERLQPFGLGNPEPVFVTRKVRVVQKRAVGKDMRHLKLGVTDGWVSFDAIAFNFGDRLRLLPDWIDVMYTFERNEYNGWQSLQLKVKDLKHAGEPD